MQVRFLLGPAGSGKTFRCLAEIRAALQEAPTGPPLLLLAPKQATFQLERQLLATGSLSGYSRLQILSFERLAHFLVTHLNPVAPDWLDEEGRVMVLRALLAQKQPELRLFHSTARLPGFATRLSQLFRELQRHQISPAKLSTLAEKITAPSQLAGKLHDFAVLLRSYQDWLAAHQLQDFNTLPDIAARALRAPLPRELRIGGLWLDGFAELTAQELDLLTALTPWCDQTTLAFCLPREINQEPPWRSTWAVIGQTFLRCLQQFKTLPDAAVTVETLPAAQSPTRFSAVPELAHLEAHWATPSPWPQPPEHIAAFTCPHPEAEVLLAAREIHRLVRAGGRYREAAVLVRNLDGYAESIRRIFPRYGIPFFLDRRESVAHHPLAELTRYALRIPAHGWRPADWFGALKTGLTPAAEEEVDWLENAALEFGWEGPIWSQPLQVPHQAALSERAERIRQKLIAPFLALARQTANSLNGLQLAAALREFWQQLQVESKLAAWSQYEITEPAAVHATVWQQMQLWLENLELAFSQESLPLREWLPVLEAGLTQLTVGVLPPALDQVLVGAVDRSRNPDLKLALVLGLNEGIFPAPPREDALLGELERDALYEQGVRLGPGIRPRLGHEWFFGYVAGTRASERLVLTTAEFDRRDNRLNRSPFLAHLQKIFPQLELQEWRPASGFATAEHVSEIIVPAIQLQNQLPAMAAPDLAHLLTLPELAPALAKANWVQTAQAGDYLAPAQAALLYGTELATSVSALENYAACPFKFFVSHGLRAAERREFELDPRERGSFQHEVLTVFHQELAAEQLRWRDLTPDTARQRVRRIGQERLQTYRNGLLISDPARQFNGTLLLESLEALIAVLVDWAQDYQFDPVLVETGFGLPGSPWPAWRLELDSGHALRLRGRIDRVDLCREPETNTALAVVMDYKSSSRKPDRIKLYHGLQLQLPAYLAVLELLPEARASFGVTRLIPAGVFYVNLRGESDSAKNHAAALEDPARARRLAYQHTGRYDEQFLPLLDPEKKGEQFKTSKQAHDRMDAAAFREMLQRVAANLGRFGAEIYSGKLAPDPFRKGTETACKYCDYAAICRFDPWTQSFRPLPEPPDAPAPAKGKTPRS